MKYRSLGKTGFEVSEIGFGAWQLGQTGWTDTSEESAKKALHAALDTGVNLIDTAAGYGGGKSERLVAQVMAERGVTPGQGQGSDRVVIVTKTPPAPGAWPPSPHDDITDRYSPEYIRTNVEERLQNLNTACLDVLLLHSWTRVWNRNPSVFETLAALKREGKIHSVGVSTPEHDQNSVIGLMRAGLVDAVEVIYNIFEQEPIAELLPVAEETGTGIIVRVVLDEGVLAGKFNEDTTFPEDDVRSRYFAGDRMARAVRRTRAVEKEVASEGEKLPDAAVKFALAQAAVSTVIIGTGKPEHARDNSAISDAPGLSSGLIEKLYKHAWRRGFWYGGK
ncbi:MAG: aldo/keto reductase [Spirochaetia bacterium]